MRRDIIKFFCTLFACLSIALPAFAGEMVEIAEYQIATWQVSGQESLIKFTNGSDECVAVYLGEKPETGIPISVIDLGLCMFTDGTLYECVVEYRTQTAKGDPPCMPAHTVGYAINPTLVPGSAYYGKSQTVWSARGYKTPPPNLSQQVTLPNGTGLQYLNNGRWNPDGAPIELIDALPGKCWKQTNTSEYGGRVTFSDANAGTCW